MPALDDFLNETAQEKIDLFDPSHVLSLETGAKYTSSAFGLTVNGFVKNLRDVISQCAVTVGGETRWLVQPGAETRSYGAEVEVTARPSAGLDLLANATLLKASYSLCPDAVDPIFGPPCPTGSDVGTFLNGVPPVIGNFSATYTLPGDARLIADLHYVHRRFSAFTATGERNELPTYHYLNLGASYPFRLSGLSVSANLLNVYQSKGLEEGNPRLSLVGGRTSDLFLARPLLPRRLMTSVRYNF